MRGRGSGRRAYAQPPLAQLGRRLASHRAARATAVAGPSSENCDGARRPRQDRGGEPRRIMAEAFPTTPRAPTVVRLSAIVIGLIGVALATRCTITSTRWVGRTFPGFLLLDNRIIASIGLAHWNGRGDLYQEQVMAVDGHPVSSAVEAYSHVEELPAGTPIHYLLRSPRGVEREVTVRSQRFELFDWVFLFGA